MSGVLSQTEIDNLLSAVGSDRLLASDLKTGFSFGGDTFGTEGIGDFGKKRTSVKMYDFKRPDKFCREQIRTIQMMYENYARFSTTYFTNKLRSFVNVHVASVAQMTFEEFIRSIPNPTTLAIIDMQPLDGSIVIEIDPSITFTMIDRLLGGGGETLKNNRELTEIELTVIESVIENDLKNMSLAWSNVINLKPTIENIETNIQFAQIVPPNEIIMLVTLEIMIGDVEGTVNICIPSVIIESILPKASAKYWYNDIHQDSSKKEKEILNSVINKSKKNIRASISNETIFLDKIFKLKPGSIVPLSDFSNTEKVDIMTDNFLIGSLTDNKLKKNIVINFSTDGNSPTNSFIESPVKEETKTQSYPSKSKITNPYKVVLDYKQKDREKKTESEKRPFRDISSCNNQRLADYLKNEHPQTISLVLSYFEPNKASHVLSLMPDELQVDIVSRLTFMDIVESEIVDSVEMVLKQKLISSPSDYLNSTGGIDVVVELLNMLDDSTERRIAKSLRKKDAELAGEIKKRIVRK